MKSGMKGKKFKCAICGFIYNKESTAKRCEEWCKSHGSCSNSITRLSVGFER